MTLPVATTYPFTAAGLAMARASTTSPIDGQLLNIATSQAITTLTLTGTIVGTLTTLALGGFASFRYGATAAKWFRVG